MPPLSFFQSFENPINSRGAEAFSSCSFILWGNFASPYFSRCHGNHQISYRSAQLSVFEIILYFFQFSSWNWRKSPDSLNIWLDFISLNFRYFLTFNEVVKSKMAQVRRRPSHQNWYHLCSIYALWTYVRYLNIKITQDSWVRVN